MILINYYTAGAYRRGTLTVYNYNLRGALNEFLRQQKAGERKVHPKGRLSVRINNNVIPHHPLFEDLHHAPDREIEAFEKAAAL